MDKRAHSLNDNKKFQYSKNGIFNQKGPLPVFAPLPGFTPLPVFTPLPDFCATFDLLSQLALISCIIQNYLIMFFKSNAFYEWEIIETLLFRIQRPLPPLPPPPPSPSYRHPEGVSQVKLKHVSHIWSYSNNLVKTGKRSMKSC